MKQIIFLLLFACLTFSISSAQVQRARVEDKGKFGYIDETGSLVIDAQYKDARDFTTSGVAWVLLKGGWALIDVDGNVIKETRATNVMGFSYGLSGAFENELWGYVNTAGEWVIKPQYERAKMFSGGMARVQKNEVWSYVNTKGEEFTSMRQLKLDDFSEGLALVFDVLKDQYGYMNKKGEWAIEPQFKKAKPFVNGHAKANDGFGNWGLINKEGNWVVKPNYLMVNNFSNGMAMVLDGKTWFYVNEKGEKIEVDGQDKIYEFKDGLGMVKNFVGLVGFVDKTGAWVIKPQFRKAKKFKRGYALALGSNKMWGIINKEGKWVVEPKYEDIYNYREGLAAVRMNKRWGFVNKEGEEVIAPGYVMVAAVKDQNIPLLGGVVSKVSASVQDKDRGFYNGYFRTECKGGIGYMTKEGQILGNRGFKLAYEFIRIRK